MQRIFLLQSFRCNKSRITIIAKLYLAQQVSKNLPIIIYEINYDSTMLCSSMDFVEKNRISGQSPSSIIPMAYKCTRKTYAQTHVIITEQGDTNKGPITPIQRVTHFSTGLHNGDTRGAGITLQEREGKKGKRKGGGEDAWSG